MGLFSKLFGKPRAQTMEDPVLGHLTYEDGYWTFLPSAGKNDIMINIVAPETGPTRLQREFFQHLSSGFPGLLHRAREFISPHLKELAYVEQSDPSTLQIYSLEIGSEEDCAGGSFVLELCDNDADTIHRVAFLHETPVDYGFDH